MSKHIIIIGAGPGGYVAAIRGAQLGARVTVIESHALGGVCLNWGCIPSKTLLSVVELGDKVKKSADLGLNIQGPVTYDLARMVTRKNKVVASLVKGIATLFSAWKITHLQGVGSLRDRRTVTLTTPDQLSQDLQGEAIIIATGSSWPNLALFPIDGKQVLTSQQLLDLTEIPPSLLIVGGGVEGCEFAALYSGLGSVVTIVELLPHVLAAEDEDMSTTMERELKKRGVQLVVNTTVQRLARTSMTVTAYLTNGTHVTVDKVLVSIGRGFNSKNLGLEQVGVETGSRGEILVNDQMATTVPGIYAIGDVVGKGMLAHVASAQGKVAVETIMGHSATIRYDVIPSGIFTLPEIGRVGLTEQQARVRALAAGGNPDVALAVGRFRYAGLGKAQATGDTTGLFKVIAEAGSGKILGVHIVGAHATDLVHEAALAMQGGITVMQLTAMIHAHPTLAEGLLEAADDAQGRAIHQIPRRSPT